MAKRRGKVLVPAKPIEGVANPWTARILAALAKSVQAILEVGHLLTAAKEDLPHGEFKRMIGRALPFSPRQAQVYMQVAADPRFSNALHATHLPAQVNTLQVLTQLSDPAFERCLATGAIHPDMTRKDAVALVKGKQTEMFDDAGPVLSGIGRGLERAIEHDNLAPDWNKLESTGRMMIEEIAASFRKLKRRAGRIAEPGEAEKFRAEVARMERRVTELAERHREVMLSIKRHMAAVDASLRHRPDDYLDPTDHYPEPQGLPTDDEEDSALKKSGGGRDVPF